MKATQVMLVQRVDGRFVTSQTAIENIHEFMEVRGFESLGLKPARSCSGIEFREEIAGQPIYKQLLGPAYGGPGIVRYDVE